MTTNPPTTPMLPVLSRVFWMMVGPLVLFVLALTIANRGNGWFTTPDVAFLAILVGMIVARWLEFQFGQPQTSTGAPATAEHLRRYVPVTLAVGLLTWLIANLAGNHWLAQ